MPPAFYHHWTQVSYGHDTSPIVLINNGTRMAAGVATEAAPARTSARCRSINSAAAQSGASSAASSAAFRSRYRAPTTTCSFIGAHTPNFYGPPVVLDQEWSQIERNAQWGIVPIIPGKSMLALIAMYRSSHDDSLWWSAFDPVHLNWMPDAPIGKRHVRFVRARAGDVERADLRGVSRHRQSIVVERVQRERPQWQHNQPFGHGMKTSAAPGARRAQRHAVLRASRQ